MTYWYAKFKSGNKIQFGTVNKCLMLNKVQETFKNKGRTKDISSNYINKCTWLLPWNLKSKFE